MKDKDRYWDCLDLAMEASHGGRTDEALADPKFLTAHLNRAELLIEEMSEFEQAVAQCDRLLSGAPDLPRPDRATEAEVYYLKSKALFYLDDLDGALFLVRRAIKAGGDVPVYRAFEGQICFELGNFEEARQRLEHAVALDPESAHAIYHLGLALERLDAPEDASRAFQQANAVDPEHYPLPVAVDAAEFEAVAGEALADLPKSIREYVENVPVLIHDFPDEELLAAHETSPQMLGIFIGVPRTEAAVTAQAEDVDRVILFKKNLEKICRTRAELAEQIQVTVKHEIGHYLGLDEDDLTRLGLA